MDPGGARLPGQVLSGISRRFIYIFFGHAIHLAGS